MSSAVNRPSVAVDRVPTLKDVSAAIALPIAALGYCRDAAGTHGVSPGSDWYGVPELERLEAAIFRARAAGHAIESLVAMLEHRRDGLRRRQEQR